jgi:alkaline phosphatase D
LWNSRTTTLTNRRHHLHGLRQELESTATDWFRGRSLPVVHGTAGWLNLRSALSGSTRWQRHPVKVHDQREESRYSARTNAITKRTSSDATFRILISPTPIVGPDRGNKNDNHANKGFTHEGDEIRAFIASQNNMYIVCGDRHWQYVSVDPKTGVKEFSCGPTTDKHASGFSQKNRSEMHKYLKIKGGFLSVTIDRKNGKPFASFKHHDTYGGVYNEELIEAKK